jgi:energy-coupling factor transporter ATP-binding protein EcfA2
MPALRLKSLRYSERKGEPKEWTLGTLSLGHTNLIVGTNSTGKTRALNVLWNLSKQLMPESGYRTGNGEYELTFQSGNSEYAYTLRVRSSKVVEEELNTGSPVDPVLLRKPSGEVEIYLEHEKRKLLFHPPDNEIAAVTRRDSLQHSFLEPLYEWASSVRHYSFGATLGKDQIIIPIEGGPEPDERDEKQVVGIFRKGKKQFGEEFVTSILSDMSRLQYNLESVEAVIPDSVKILSRGLPLEPLAMGVREAGIGVIDQAEMSQGMFRALSILVQVNYSLRAKSANCILVDDIGEGLDFERSSRLIEVLQEKAQYAAFQLVMTTNDRFVMNSVPLESWSVLQRDGGKVAVRNYENSKQHFDNFKFTGLNNFDFLRYDFLSEDPDRVFEEVGSGSSS